MIDFDAARVAMVDRQVRTADVTRLSIIEAMLAVPRERFVPRALRDVAYAEAPVPLAPGRFLLEPRTFAKMLEAVAVSRGDLVLDVGAGAGYSTAVIARLAAAVVALEQDEAMAAALVENAVAFELDNVIPERGPLAQGAPAAGPFDVIVVEGAVAREPAALLAQLKDGGRLVAIHAEGPMGQARVWTRAGEAVGARRVFDAAAAVLPGFDAAPAFQF